MTDRLEQPARPESEGVGNPIEYTYGFPPSKAFEVSRLPDDSLSIVLKEGKQIIFDFGSLLPKGWRFVTDEYKWRKWSANVRFKHVHVGLFEGPQDILGLLHEIGHANIDSDSQETLQLIKYRESGTSEEQAKLESIRERRAWAFALFALRSLNRKQNLDLNQLFPTSEAARNYIDRDLRIYKEGYKHLFGTNPTFEKELIFLFDKSKT